MGSAPRRLVDNRVMRDRWSEIEWFIFCFGMSDATTWSFDADDRWWLLHGTPGPTLGVFPLREGDPPASFHDVLFIANCLAFDHDLPIFVRPARDNPAFAVPLVPPVVPEPGPDPGQFYWSALSEGIAMVAELRVGAGSVLLRYEAEGHPLSRFTNRFGSRQEALGLYAMAARQIDPFTEYLCLYRVIEWAGGGRAEAWIERRLNDLGTYDFGECFVRLDMTREYGDVFETWRERALARVAEIDKPARRVAEELSANRNAIAHGSFRVKHHDFGASMTAIGADLAVVKLLARMAVEDP
jgi:hypothetical protein